MVLSKTTQSQPSSSKRSSATIFVAEDEALIRETIALALENEGYTVLTTADNLSVLDWFRPLHLDNGLPSNIDLLILDLMLPGVNGLDVCRFLREQGYLLPILMISAKSSETDRIVGLEVGADDYLAKPFGLQELTARCRALLRRSYLAQPQEATLCWKDLIVYPESCRVTMKGKVLTLSPKEFRLLELFVQHPRRVWERKQLIERVWGEDYYGDTKTVDVHIRWLREKLEQNPSQPEYIQTVRGFGYRLS